MNKEESIIQILMSGNYSYVAVKGIGRLEGSGKELYFPAVDFAKYEKIAEERKYGHTCIYIIEPNKQ